jgi:2-C-methyl-D-erythritol 2,4-cyclodiphosphate synthase
VRIGLGYDVHRLVPGRRLVLGGVEIPFHLGLAGYSDADVALHALCDALLGAAALGDIGQHFPPGDPRFRDIDSRRLLQQVGRLIADLPARVVNVDLVVLAEQPRLAPYIPAMRSAIAAALGISPAQVSVKAATNEGLGFVGRGEGIAAYAVALIDP